MTRYDILRLGLLAAPFGSTALLSGTAVRKMVLVVQEGLGQVVLFPPDHPERKKAVRVGEKPHEIEVTPDGKTAFVSNFGLLEVNHQIGTPGTTISVLDVRAVLERARFQLPAGCTAPHGLKLRPPKHRELFTNTEVGREAMVVFDAVSGMVLRTFDLPPGVHNFIFQADGRSLFAFTTTGRVLKVDPKGGAILAQAEIAAPRGLGWTADRRRLIVGGRNELVLLNPADLSVEARFGHLGVGQIFYPSVSADGRWILAPAVLDGILLVIDAKTGQVAQRVKTGSPLLVVPDGKHAWVSNVLVPPQMMPAGAEARNGGVALLDLETFAVVSIGAVPDANGIAVAAPR
ncbi:PQQ-binding-like beta-propeller repeat protein [uncultured Paludibaculum sp.]|uniref:YncE family protein n=1 Tax=uncultured Paludibaculum sp. TaxID=1765020 RepID=UPI002AAC2DF2|nr:PQQ-binding-like beta-propeller repeat protein [uncultured Paludibaculum sp.]